MQPVGTPLLTIIIPTYNRPQLLQRAVESALKQTIDGAAKDAIEILVIDDCSPEPVMSPDHPRVNVVRLASNRGGSAARNEGARVAKGRYITYLDDDDRLLPNMAAIALNALENSELPGPVAVLGGIEVVDQAGQVKSTRLPPTLPKGSHFALEDSQPGKSFLCKQTMVVEKDVLLSIGGFDESFHSRVHTEFFLRLNQACSILGLPVVTYQLRSHEGPRVSRNPALRQRSFEQLIVKHRPLFEAHPQQFAGFLYRHAQASFRLGQHKAALRALARAFQTHPRHSLGLMAHELINR